MQAANTLSVLLTLADLAAWLPPALVGAMFTLVGSLKLYGLMRGVVGGAEKPFLTRLCGT
jgi:hypothetical protein